MFLFGSTGAVYRAGCALAADIKYDDYVDEVALDEYARNLNRCPSLRNNAVLKRFVRDLARYRELRIEEEALPDYVDATAARVVKDVNALGKRLLHQCEAFESNFRQLIQSPILA